MDALIKSAKIISPNSPFHLQTKDILIENGLIVKIGKNKYVVSSLKYKSLYFFELNNQKKLINLEQIEVSERIRDLKFYDDKLYLFMEDTASIGLINLK